MQRQSALLLLCAAVALVAAAPAFPGPHDLPLTDGTTLRVWNTGDEFTGPRYVDAEGRHVYIHNDGTPSYYGPTGAPAEPLVSRRQAAEQAKYSPSTMPDEWDAEARQRRVRFNEGLSAGALAKRLKARATEPLVFVLVQYPDFFSRPGTNEHIQKMVFGPSSAAGVGDTINGYYDIASDGKFQWTRAPESSNVSNDGVIGPVTVPCAWVNHSQWGVYPDYSCVERNGLLLAAQYLDLASFDLNGDKFLDGSELHVVLVIAGGELSTLSPAGVMHCPHVWGFMCPGASFKVTAQGITFGEHVVIGENWVDCTVPFNIGVLTHELGHTLSLPDIYDQDKGGQWVGPFCLMDGGCWNNGGKNPGMISPFLRSYLGWLTPTVVSPTSTASISLPPVGNHPNAVLQFGSNPNGVDWEWDSRHAHSGVGEYYLVENRQPVGLDQYADAVGGGVLVWHINEAAAPQSTHASALSNIEKLVRKTVNAVEGNRIDDYLTQAGRKTLYCGIDPTVVPNTLLDNESASCVSMSATIDTATGIATIEPWSDAACGSCVFGQGGLAVPTTQYSIIEQFGFSLVPMESNSSLTFYSGFAPVKLPFTFTFGGAAYNEAFICANGYINFVSINTGASGSGKYPTIAPYAGETPASYGSARTFTCSAPLPAGQCYAVQWNYAHLVNQVVLHENGNAYYIYSGNVTTGFTTYVSTGVSGSIRYADGLWTAYDWTLPAAKPAALLVAPRPMGLLPLPFVDSFETVSASSWSNVLCGQSSDVCGSASGKALTFDPTNCHNNMAVPWGIDVSGCANVSIAFSFGPSAAKQGCSPVATTVWWGYTLGAQTYPSWIGAPVGRTVELVATNGATSLYLLFDSMNAGMFYIDEVNISCAAVATSESSTTTPSSHGASGSASAEHSNHAESSSESGATGAPSSSSSSSSSERESASGTAHSSKESSSDSFSAASAAGVCAAVVALAALLAL
eukprot:m51a1_g956 hypothetical protein (966) ;mRNA; f:309573-312881